MWLKIDNDKYWVKCVTKERGAYTNKLIAVARGTKGPCCTVPFNIYLDIGIQVAFIDEENDMWGCGMVYGDPIHIRDEITLMKVIDCIDNETALEKLEAL